MRKQSVTISRILESNEVTEGKRYYFQSSNGIRMGTAVKCDKCSKLCSSNSVMIVSFGVKSKEIKVAPLTDDELSYSEEEDMCLCSDCIN